MTISSIRTRRLPGLLKRLLSSLFIFAAVPLFVLPSASCASSVNFPIGPATTLASTALGSKRKSASTLLLQSNAAQKTLAVSPGIVVKDVLTSFGSWLKNLLSMVQELLTGGFLVPQTEPPTYGSPLGGDESLFSEIESFAVQERSLIITEKFVVHGVDGPYCLVKRRKGLKLLFSKTDRMRIYFGGERVATLESIKRSQSYGVRRGKTGEKIGVIEKTVDKNKKEKFIFYSTESTANSEKAVTEPQAIYELSGDFIDRRFVMRNGKDKCVAKVKKQLIAFPHFDHYVVRIAAGMDPLLVLACTCVIDNELDYEKKEKANNAVKGSVLAVGSLGKKIISFLNPF